MIPRVTTGTLINSSETPTHRVNFDSIDFDFATEQFANFSVITPNNWVGGTLTVEFHWTADSGSGGVVWGAAAHYQADGLAIDTVFGTEQIIADTLTSAGGNCISSQTPAITPAGTPAAGVEVVFRIARKVAEVADNLGVNARLRKVRIRWTPS
jgi:hypothetical protein